MTKSRIKIGFAMICLSKERFEVILVESVKTLKVGSVGPLFEDWALFVVVVRDF